MENENTMNTTEISDKPKMITFFEHESEVARLERTIKRLWISVLVVFAAFVLSNLIWLRYEMTTEDVVTVTQDIDTAESPAFVNATGDMTVYGEDIPKLEAKKNN